MSATTIERRAQLATLAAELGIDTVTQLGDDGHAEACGIARHSDALALARSAASRYGPCTVIAARHWDGSRWLDARWCVRMAIQ